MRDATKKIAKMLRSKYGYFPTFVTNDNRGMISNN
jgi:hypothetical protein